MNFVEESRIIEWISVASLIMGTAVLAHILIQDAETSLVLASSAALSVPLALSIVRRIQSKRSVVVEVLSFAAAAIFAAKDEVLLAALVLFTVCLCRVSMDYAVGRAYAGITDRLENIPLTVTVVRNGEKVPVRTVDVRTGDIVHVGSGDCIAFDGRIVKGSGCIDTSLLDGREDSSFVKVGQNVRGGTMNLFGFFDMEVACPITEGTVGNLISVERNMREGHFEASVVADRIMDIAFAGSFSILTAAAFLAAPADGMVLFNLISVSVTAVSILLLRISGRLEGTGVENRYRRTCCSKLTQCNPSDGE